jgi:Helix-turn-helix domain
MPRELEESKRAASPLEPNPRRAPEPSGQERQYAPKDAADFLNVSTSFLAKARMRGDGPPYGKFGRSVRYGEGALVRYMKSRQRLSTSEK